MKTDRYSRQENYKKIGKKGQILIEKTSVTIIGIGALGTTTSELLVRSGVGELKLFDEDIIELNNLQRQTLYEEKDVGKLKVRVAEQKLKKINTQTKITSFNQKITEENIHLINSDLILECTDDLNTKFLLNKYCKKNKIPWISASAIQNIGMIIVFDDFKKCLQCIIQPTNKLKTCKEVGVLNTITNIVASIQVSEAIKKITNQPTEQKIIRINLNDNTLKKINYIKKSDCKGCKTIIETPNTFTTEGFVKNCDSYSIQGKKIDLKKIRGSIEDSKLTKDGLFSENVTILNNGKIIIKTSNKKKAEKIYKRITAIAF